MLLGKSHPMALSSPASSSTTFSADYASPEELRLAIQELRDTFPEKHVVTTDPDTLQLYGSSENSYHPSSPHSVVVRVFGTEDVVKVVNISRKYRVPVTAYSGATSLEANAVRYGTARAEWFLNVVSMTTIAFAAVTKNHKTAVLPSGEVIKTRSRARKSATGFDTTKLFIGAEGTLATLRLAPVIPTKVAMAQFADVEHAVSAVQEILNSPYGPHLQCIELLDDHMMEALNIAGQVKRPFPVKDTLFFKIQGAPEAIKLTSDVVREITVRHGSDRFEFAATDEEAADLWSSRKYALSSSISLVPGCRCWTSDVCVPTSKLPELVYETKKDMANSGITSTIVGHVGDGNFHALMLFNNDDELHVVTEAVHRLVHRAIALDGTCTGEHGVGVGKKEYLPAELGEGTVELMRTVKKAIDPMNLFNPGKLYPDAQQSHEERGKAH
ncbi:hypothetical protein HWV62_13511 [Athelia sp. TMB]|nr:hypothetical protein HWV62_13511 [Athelia sp. TMB]